MAEPASELPVGRGIVVPHRRPGASGHSLLEGIAPARRLLDQLSNPGDMICLDVERVLFTDPEWGPVSFTLSIWRSAKADLPEYEVVIE